MQFKSNVCFFSNKVWTYKTQQNMTCFILSWCVYFSVFSGAILIFFHALERSNDVLFAAEFIAIIGRPEPCGFVPGMLVISPITFGLAVIIWLKLTGHISPSFSYTLQASISKLMNVTDSKRHALDGQKHITGFQSRFQSGTQWDLRFRKPVDTLLQ